MWDWVAAHFNAQDVFNQYGLHVNKIFLLHFLHPPGIYYIFCFISYFVAFRVCVAVCRIIRECKRECEYECILATNVCTRCIRILFIILFFVFFFISHFNCSNDLFERADPALKCEAPARSLSVHVLCTYQTPIPSSKGILHINWNRMKNNVMKNTTLKCVNYIRLRNFR